MPCLRGLSRVSFRVNYLIDYLGKAISKFKSFSLYIKRVFLFIDLDIRMKFSWKRVVCLGGSYYGSLFDKISDEGGGVQRGKLVELLSSGPF